MTVVFAKLRRLPYDNSDTDKLKCDAEALPVVDHVIDNCYIVF
jgi:hypothetical protein